MSKPTEDRWNHHDRSFWEKNHNIIRTKLGGVVEYPNLVCCGYDLFKDLVGKVSWMEMFYLLLKGRLPKKPVLRLLDAICACTSYPDPRIWPHRVGRLSAAMKPIQGAALAASLAALDARMFGCTSLARTVAFLSGLVKRGVTPDTVDTIKRYLTAVKRKIIIVCTCYVNHHRSHWPVVVDIRV